MCISYMTENECNNLHVRENNVTQIYSIAFSIFETASNG